MNIQQFCSEVVEDADGALGCLLIDMKVGRALALAERPDAMVSANEVDLLIKLSTDLFHGKLIAKYAQALQPDGESSEFIEETQVAAESTNTFILAVPSWGAVAIILIVERSQNLGLGWQAVRQAQERLTGFQPQDRRAALASSVDGLAQRTRPSGPTAAVKAPRSQPAPEAIEDDEEHRSRSQSTAPNIAGAAANQELSAGRRLGAPAIAAATPDSQSEPGGSRASFGVRARMYSPRKKAGKRKR